MSMKLLQIGVVLDNPKLTPARNAASYPNNVTNGEIPRRFIYPTSEITANPVNYNVPLKRLSGGDKMTSRVMVG